MIGRYFFLQCKKALKAIVRLLLGIIAAVSLIAGISFFLTHSFSNLTEFKKVNVALVLSDEDSMTKLLANFISSMESVSSVCDFSIVSKEEAFSDFENGDLQAIVLLPEGFYDDVNDGYNTPVSVYLPINESLNTRIFEELMSVGASYVRTTEAAVYATLTVTRENGVYLDSSYVGDYVFSEFIGAVFDRNKAFMDKPVSPFPDSSVMTYYFVATLCVVISLSGFMFLSLYKKNNKALEDKLNIYGLNCLNSSLMKILIMSVFSFILSLFVFFLGFFLSEVFKLYFAFFDKRILVLLFLACVLESTFVDFLFSMFNETKLGAVAYLHINIVLFMISGVFIPESFLPSFLHKAGDFLFTKSMMKVLLEAFNGSYFGNSIWIFGLFSFIFFSLGVFFKWRNSLSVTD